MDRSNNMLPSQRLAAVTITLQHLMDQLAWNFPENRMPEVVQAQALLAQACGLLRTLQQRNARNILP